MTVLQSVHTLSNTTPTAITVADNMPQEVHIHNMTKSSNEYVHIGNASVSTANSIHLDPGESKVIRLPALDTLYAVSEPSGLAVGVLQLQRRD